MRSLYAGLILLSSGILLAAFGTHALSDILSDNALKTYQTATNYHLLIAITLIALDSHLTPRNIWFSPLLITLGILIFSGSLYALSFFQIKYLGYLTPIGGICMILGIITTMIELKNHG